MLLGTSTVHLHSIPNDLCFHIEKKKAAHKSVVVGSKIWPNIVSTDLKI